MNRIQGLIVLGSLVAVFIFFADPKLLELNDDIKLGVNVYSKRIKPTNENEFIFNYTVDNRSNIVIDGDNYFFRLTLTRAVGACGFVIKEFTKEIVPMSSFNGSYTWNIDHLPAEGTNLKVYFELYEIQGGEYILVSSSSTPPLEFSF